MDDGRAMVRQSKRRACAVAVLWLAMLPAGDVAAEERWDRAAAELAVPHVIDDGGSPAEGSGGRDPETAAPDTDTPDFDTPGARAPSEDGTPSAEEPDDAPPPGCPFNSAPLELIG